MPARYRTRPNTYTIGRGLRLNTWNTQTVLLTWSDTCSDVTGSPGVDHTFVKTKGWTNGAVLSGDNGQVGILRRLYDNYPPNGAGPGIGSAPAVNAQALITSLLAKANPSTASVQLPVFIFELRELPRLILLAGRSIAGKFASANLAYQFGWKPLLGDLTKLFNFQDAVNRRVKDLERLQSGSGLRKRKTLGRYEGTVTQNNVYMESLISSVVAEMSTVTTQEIWGTVRWFPNPLNLPQTDEERLKHARRLVLGMTWGQQLSNLWEALPWSWLVDWCVNVQDFIEASNNTLTAPSPRVNLMIRTKAVRTYRITSKPSWVQCNPASPVWSYERKERIPSVGIPSFQISLPFLTNGQLSILGSLAILRRKG
nr:MAG: putative maturation protein [Leviviridae sp.]